MPKEPNNKFVMFFIFLLSLFLTSTYSSGFASIMTIPRYEKPINTVEELAESGLYWGATQDAWILSIERADEWTYKEIVGNFLALTEEELRKRSLTNEFGFSVERLPSDDFAVGFYIQDDVIGNYQLMGEDLYWEQCVIMTRKNSVLLPSLDQFILIAFQAGLISKWQNQAVESSMDLSVQKALKNSNANHEKVVTKLKWIHVEGAFAALIIGYCVSSFVFIFEILMEHGLHWRKKDFLCTKT